MEAQVRFCAQVNTLEVHLKIISEILMKVAHKKQKEKPMAEPCAMAHKFHLVICSG